MCIIKYRDLNWNTDDENVKILEVLRTANSNFMQKNFCTIFKVITCQVLRAKILAVIRIRYKKMVLSTLKHTSSIHEHELHVNYSTHTLL